MRNFISSKVSEYQKLFRSIPSIVVALYCVSVVGMNLMANKIIINTPFLGADGGYLLSWIPFLCMDVVVNRFGAKSATRLNILGLGVNLLFVSLFALVGNIQYDFPGCEQGNIYDSFNSVFCSCWFVVLCSSIAYLSSGIVNNYSNEVIGKIFGKKLNNSKALFFIRSYGSTLIGQMTDNLIFTTLTFMIFAPKYWGYSLTFRQCFGSAVFGTILELLFEVVFSPLGYKISKKWKEDNIGTED